MSSDNDVTDLGPENDEGVFDNVQETPDIPEIGISQPLDDENQVNSSHRQSEENQDEHIGNLIARTDQDEPLTPDDTPSLQDSVLSSPRRPRLGSPAQSLRPFDRRFSARLSPSPLASPRPISPAFLTGRSRQSSALNNFLSSESGDGSIETPWEVFKWTKLRKLSEEAFSELAKRNYGRPICMAVASLIAIGTSKGLILIFDYQQNLKTTIGLGTKSVESGAVTAISLSADYSIVAGGHANGNIFTWEIARPAKPFLSILALSVASAQTTGTDGHILDASVLHLGFLGTRHTALVSADVRGMAFSHLATRGLGAIARSVKTARVLGRYPEISLTPAKPRKPSSVLALSPMPLGNLESPIDGLGLVAMLTPYLLVVVSTTPVPQTQHKASRPKELTEHGAMTGSLAWYPVMKGKLGSSNAKLAYCWLNVVTILEVTEIINETDKDSSPPDLTFKIIKRWKADESIVALQWLNRSIVAILTISQQLIVLEDDSLTVTDSSDLLKRHVYHTDLFSQQLSYIIESLDQEDTSMHGVVADAFYMSFKAYKGRLFLLGFNDICIGTLSNWADRLFALMQQGDFIGSIQLATSYYRGGPEMAAIGLPLDEESRHELVREKLLEMMAASLRYAFGKNPDADARLSNDQLEHLARSCFTSCLQLGDLDFLFEEVYTWYSDNDADRIFLEILEACIAEQEIKSVPPVVLRDLINTFVAHGRSTRLEEILCLLEPSTMDLEQVTLLCRKFKLFDALFYVWSQAIGDYTTVLKNLLAQLQDTHELDEDEARFRIFPYLSYTLTGRVYPTGDWMPEDTAFKAKCEVYHFLFSGSSGQSYDHIRQALNIDAPSFLSVLNEAFEDPFLDGASDSAMVSNGYTEEERFASTLTRQYIIRVLLNILVQPDYELDDTIYLDMFVARNQPKFPQFIRLSGSVLQKVMVNLCLYPSDEVSEDCQLSLEYLLSVYQPPDISSLLPDLEAAKFYRVMKSIYRSEKQYANLLRTSFRDIENPDGIFETIRECLKTGSDLTEKQRDDVRSVVAANASRMTEVDLQETADVIDEFAPDLHPTFIEHMSDNEQSQYQYLKHVLEKKSQPRDDQKVIHEAFTERYIRLLCEHNPHHVSEYLDILEFTALHLDEILPALESSGVIDAAVVLMAKDGQVRQAMDRLMQHISYLEVALSSLIEGAVIAPDIDNTTENVSDLVETIVKYSSVGVWLCNLHSINSDQSAATKTGRRSSRVPTQRLDEPLSFSETLWLDLMDAVVRIAKHGNEIESIPESDDNDDSESVVYRSTVEEALQKLRINVQDTFTALLVAAATSRKDQSSQSNLSFLRILKAFLSRISESSPSLAHLRDVLSSIFSAYAFEENLLVLSNRLLDKDLFIRVEDITERRKRGWRPSGQTCNGCRKRVWGPGIGIDAWNAWFNKQDGEDQFAAETPRDAANYNNVNHSPAESEPSSSVNKKGKGKAPDNGQSSQGNRFQSHAERDGTVNNSETTAERDSLIIFSCRHVWHRACLGTATNGTSVSGELECPLETPALSYSLR